MGNVSNIFLVPIHKASFDYGSGRPSARCWGWGKGRLGIGLLFLPKSGSGSGKVISAGTFLFSDSSDCENDQLYIAAADLGFFSEEKRHPVLIYGKVHSTAHF